MSEFEKQIDLVVSLGGNCDVAAQLRKRGKRPFSLPFDWLYMMDDKPVRYLPSGFLSGFESFCRRENLKRMGELQDLHGTTPFHYKDTETGWVFIHHFHKELDRGGYEEVRRKIDKRIDRMFQLMKQANTILFILETSFVFEESLGEKIYETLKSMYPEKNISLMVMQFSSNSPCKRDRIWGEHGGLFRYERERSVYDHQQTSCEWAFLDTISSPWFKDTKPTGFSKLLYKAYKYIGKRLRARGIRV